jgi:hypothetical protein
MRQKIKLVLLMLMSAVFGASCVFFYYWEENKEFIRIIDNEPYLVIGASINDLNALHRELYSRLVDEKESTLNSELYMISLSQFSKKNLSDKQFQELIRAVKYREQHPFQTGDTNVDAEVKSFLQKIQKKRLATNGITKASN